MALKALVAGSCGDPILACYWDSDQVIHYLDVPGTADISIATDIMKVGSNIYVCGYWVESGIVTGCTWTNGVRDDLPGYKSFATGLFVHEGSLYVSGRYWTGVFTQACYWIDGVKTDLTSEDTRAYSIWTDGTDIIIGGDTNAIGACVWVNGVISYLPFTGDYAWVYSMSVYDGVVYCSGYDYDGDLDVDTACYWIDDVQHLLDSTGGVVVQKIFVDASGIHMIGADDYDAASTACSWLNEVRTDLDMAGYEYTYGMGIKAVGGTAWCVGNGSNPFSAGLLWTDPDTMIELSTDNGAPRDLFMWDEPEASGGSWFGR
jgi:hypothetical protein